MMKTSVLLVGHGSRHQPGNTEIEQFSAHWQQQNPQWQIQTCFIEFAEVMLERGLNRAAKGVDRVIVVPLILNAAGHVRAELPHYIEHAAEQHPEVKFVYAAHLGAGEEILTILKRNLRKTLLAMHMPDPQTTGVIILGRGSSDRQANGEIAKMARWLFEDSGHELIDEAFTGISFPRLEKVVQRQVMLGMTQIAVLPYYLFTGTLMERIGQQIERLRVQYPDITIECATYFGFEKEIYAMLTDRVTAAMAADYVSAAMQDYQTGEFEHHHHHHAETTQ